MQNKKKILPEIYNFLRPKQTENIARFGVQKDGGYIVEMSVLNRVNHLVSFGMSDEFSFEIDFLKINNLNAIQIYDYSVNHKNYLLNIFKVFRRTITFRKNIKQLIEAILKYVKFLKFINNKKVNFFPLKVSKQIEEKNQIDIESVFSKLDDSINNIGLKLDIEGDEYNILDDVMKNSKKVNFLIVEFHEIEKNQKTFIKIMKDLIINFDILHLHGNNHGFLLPDGFPNVLEISMVNKKNNLNYVNYPTSFPIKDLDYPNNPFKPDIEINFG